MSPLEPFPLITVCLLRHHRPHFQWRMTEHGAEWGAWCERCDACTVYAPLATHPMRDGAV